MYKYIFSAIIILDETKSFIRVKPFYCTVIHISTSIFIICINFIKKLTHMQIKKNNSHN